jgi:hypothetical protein
VIKCPSRTVFPRRKHSSPILKEEKKEHRKEIKDGTEAIK